MKVLVFGGGAREHAIAEKISQSKLLTKLFLASPNDGFKHLGQVIYFKDFEDLARKSKKFGIELLVVGPELPLSQGIVDIFAKQSIKSIGADKEWTQLESSKSFAKDFMNKHSIPTASYELINDKSQIKETLDRAVFPVVIKADGLAAGKGVVIVQNRKEAELTLNTFLDGKYSDASKKIVLEEFLEGEELSLISIWDGKTLLPFICARDYKRLLEENKGPNTGGMGAYCPVSLTIAEQEYISDYVDMLSIALRNENADFVGIVYSGLMLTPSGVKVLEYNMRFGDPETQSLLMHLESDLLEIFIKAASQQLKDVELTWKSGTSACAVIAADGYPENPKKGSSIKNIDYIKNEFGVDVYYAGVKKEAFSLVSNGGRVLSVCRNAENPYPFIYGAIDELKFADKIFRKDIGR